MSQVKDIQLLQKISLVLKELREASLKTQAEVYEETGIHIARIESVRSNVSISTLSSLCSYFDISLVDFFKKVERLTADKSKGGK